MFIFMFSGLYHRNVVTITTCAALKEFLSLMDLPDACESSCPPFVFMDMEPCLNLHSDISSSIWPCALPADATFQLLVVSHWEKISSLGGFTVKPRSTHMIHFPFYICPEQNKSAEPPLTQTDKRRKETVKASWTYLNIKVGSSIS